MVSRQTLRACKQQRAHLGLWSMTVTWVVECRVDSEQEEIEWGQRGHSESRYKKCPRWYGNRREGTMSQ